MRSYFHSNEQYYTAMCVYLFLKKYPDLFHWGPFIYYVITILGFLDPPPPLRQHDFSTKNQQKLAFSDPPSPPTSADVIYEWSLSKVSVYQNLSLVSKLTKK